ncbi:MAG: hypothetical protein IKA76_06705 [Clostridia bacterium]|nr:hypothetical protein [Clostridia bacterium]
MKKRKIITFALLFCFSLLFVGCRETEENIPAGDSEILFDTEEVEVEATGSEKITEMEETTETDPIAESEELTESEEITELEQITDTENEEADLGDGLFPSHPFDGLSCFCGTLVRWEHVVGESDPFSGLTSVSSEFEKLRSNLVMINVQILDVMEYEHWRTDEIAELNVLFLPRDAMKYVVEGEESLVFLYQIFVGHTEENTPVYMWTLYPYELSEWAYPIFRYEDGRMVIDEKQANVVEGYTSLYEMMFLTKAYQANKYLSKYSIDEKYHFRNGMTVEELEQFYNAVANLPMPNE